MEKSIRLEAKAEAPRTDLRRLYATRYRPLQRTFWTLTHITLRVTLFQQRQPFLYRHRLLHKRNKFRR